ncbi:MAG: adenylyl-sulfate kinase [Calditrichaeota bacterium]|nr:MAG: adenylyl-sulfate kinase [Calditrichota bacterium]
MAKNIVWQEYQITKNDREVRNNHKASVLWFTGYSGSGKSTLANAVAKELFKKEIQTFSLDGDNVRHGLNKDLGFSDLDRKENIRRISEVAKLFAESGMIITTAFISPFKEDRDFAREIIGDDFIEIFVDTPLEICKSRDPKGLYQKALNGEIKNFTGLDSPYEIPENPEIKIKTESLSVEKCVEKIINELLKREIF